MRKEYKERLLKDIQEYFESEKGTSDVARKIIKETNHSDDEKNKIFMIATIHENTCERMEKRIKSIIENSCILVHGEEKDAEIEKYKKAFESAKHEKDKAVCECQNEIDRLKSRISELEEAQETLPAEPIKMADWIVRHFKQGIYPVYETNYKGEIQFIEIGGKKVPIETGEYIKHGEAREIADHLLAYCKYHSEED